MIVHHSTHGIYNILFNKSTQKFLVTKRGNILKDGFEKASDAIDFIIDHED